MDEHTKDTLTTPSTHDSTTSSVNGIDVDKIWIALGQYGRYQVTHVLMVLVSVWALCFHQLSIVFIGYRPEVKCSRAQANGTGILLTNNTVKVEYNTCSIKMNVNISGNITESFECTSGWNYTYRNNEHFPAERSFVSEWDLVCSNDELTELTQTLVMVGQVFGSVVFASLSDRLGRKPIFIGCHISLFFVTMATAFLPNYTSFAVARLLTGAVVSGVSLAAAILNLEMFPMKIRSNVEVVGQLSWSTGVALMTPLAYLFRNISWRYMQICLSCCSAWSLIQWWLVDESLRWLIVNGKYDKAKAVIRKACKMNKKNFASVMEESGFHKFETNEDRQSNKEENETLVQTAGARNDEGIIRQPIVIASTKKYTFLDLVKAKHLFVTSIIIWFMWLTNSATYYGLILLSSSLAGDRFLNFFLGSLVEYPAAFVEYHMFNRFGRKPTCTLFHVICCVSLLTATVLTTTANGSEAMLLASAVFTLIGKFAITGSFSTIYLYTPEMYPTNMRNLGVGMSSAAARVGSMVAPFSRNLAERAVWAPGLIFGIMCAIVVLSLWWVPETNQHELPQTLEDAEMLCKNKSVSDYKGSRISVKNGVNVCGYYSE